MDWVRGKLAGPGEWWCPLTKMEHRNRTGFGGRGTSLRTAELKESLRQPSAHVKKLTGSIDQEGLRGLKRRHLFMTQLHIGDHLNFGHRWDKPEQRVNSVAGKRDTRLQMGPRGSQRGSEETRWGLGHRRQGKREWFERKPVTRCPEWC